jgi:hypothetical protein
VEQWELSRNDLALDEIAPYELDLGSNAAIRAVLLVRHFSARNGMLIITDSAGVSQRLERINELGYGFSVLEGPRGSASEGYDRKGLDHPLRFSEGPKPECKVSTIVHPFHFSPSLAWQARLGVQPLGRPLDKRG